MTVIRHIFFTMLVKSIFPLSFTINNSTSLSLESQKLNFLESFLVKLKIFTGSPNCTSFITESRNETQNGHIPILWEYLEKGHDLSTKVLMVFDMEHLKGRKTHTPFTFHFSTACSLVLHKYFENKALPKDFRKFIPGGIFRSYHLFLKPSTSLRDLIQSPITPGLEIRYFAVSEFDQESTIFKHTKPNWNLRPVITALEPGAGLANIKSFKDTGKWNHYMVATLYYMSQYMNATPEFISISSMPIRGRLESGGWGDFVDPLIPGSVQICTAVIPSYYPRDLIFFTKSILYTEYYFLSALPREKSISSFETLINPFSFDIWIGIILSIIGIFLVLQFSVIFSLVKTNSTFAKNLCERRSTEALLTIFRPILEQPGLDMNLQKVFQSSSSAWRLLIVWSMGVMILVNYYKCNVISGFVIPSFSYPPRNFLELMNSDFKINGILFDGTLDKTLRQVNNTLTKFLLARTKDTGWPHGREKCMLEILNWDSVCLGARAILNPLSRVYLTNSHRQPRFQTSEDTIMQIGASYGVSRHYPEVLDSLDKIISLLDPSGLYLYWTEVNIQKLTSIGRSISRRSQVSDSDNSKNWRISAFLLEITIGGNVFTGVVFLAELLYSWSKKFQRKKTVTGFMW